MKNTVFCRKYKKDLPRMDRPPFPGEEGEVIFSNVSKQAWMEWLQHQTMLINERQLDLSKKDSRDYLKSQLESFLNNESVDKADGFVPLDK
jgi:Fe-S cluster biosynthesis and repair protein YggX|tara:strand:+ start:201 stop:473 length:273 start_codon:yes stop_codon:yes gene_type:complete